MEEIKDLESIDDLSSNVAPRSTTPEKANLPGAIGALICGIMAILGAFQWGIGGIVSGIIAISLHNKDKRLYRQDPEKYAGRWGMSRAGFVTGLIGLILGGLVFIILMLAIATDGFRGF